jgi:hypothetical protein
MPPLFQKLHYFRREGGDSAGTGKIERYPLFTGLWAGSSQLIPYTAADTYGNNTESGEHIILLFEFSQNHESLIPLKY